MSYTYHIDHDLEVGFIKLSDYVDADQIMEAAEEMYGNDAWQPHYNSLWDFRSTSVVDISPTGLKAILAQKEARDREGVLHGKIAALIDRKALQTFGEVVAYRSKSSSRKAHPFSRESEARAWLNLPQDADLWQWTKND